MKIPSPQVRRLMAAREYMPERTVLRTYRDPLGVKPATLERVTRAARELGVEPPASATVNNLSQVPTT